MIGEIVPGERVEVMDMGQFGRTPRFFIALQRLSEYSPLRGHIAQFKEGGTQLTRIVSQPMSGHRFLQVIFGSAEITSFHRQSGTKQALASPQKYHASWVFEGNVDVKPRLCCCCRRLAIIGDQGQFSQFKVRWRLRCRVSGLRGQVEILLIPGGGLLNLTKRAMHLTERMRETEHFRGGGRGRQQVRELMQKFACLGVGMVLCQLIKDWQTIPSPSFYIFTHDRV